MFSAPTPAGRKPPILSLKTRYSNKHHHANAVVAISPSALRRPISTALWEAGWNVDLAKSAGELRRLARIEHPHVVAMLASPAGQESGWLTCRKLTLENPNLKVILLADHPTERDRRLARFVGGVDCLPVSDVSRVIQAAGKPQWSKAH
jgi:CheY-like chemotaxis protein